MNMLKRIVISGLLLASAANGTANEWRELYEPLELKKLPCRVMKPINFDGSKRYPVIVSLHGAGGKGSDNRKQLKPWNQQLAEKERRTEFPCYVVAPQAPGLWNAEHLKQINKAKDSHHASLKRSLAIAAYILTNAKNLSQINVDTATAD